MNLPQGEKIKGDQLIGCTNDPNGNTVGKYNDNPLFNSMLYDIELPDGKIKEYSANIIGENMYARVDADGYVHSMMESILDSKRDSSAIDKEDMYITTESGQRPIWKTNLGWKLLVQWKTKTYKWIPLKDLKESNPLEVSEFSSERGIESEPTFYCGYHSPCTRDIELLMQ